MEERAKEMDTTMPIGNQMIVSVEDASMLKELKRAISLMRGVTKVSIPKRKRCSSYDLSMQDIKDGRVNSYDSVDDFFKQMGL